MNNLQQLQDVWKGFKPDQNFKVDNSKIYNSILNRIKHTENRIYKKNVIKTLVISILMISYLWFFYQLGIFSVFIWLGVGCIFISTLVFMIIYWKIQFRSSSLKHDLPQNEFINDAIFQMKQHRIRFVKLFRAYVCLLILGINLVYLDLLKDENIANQFSLHLGITILLIITYILGLKMRKKKFNRDFKPIIDELESIKE